MATTDETVNGMVERILEDIGRAGTTETEAAIRRAIVRQLSSARTERHYFAQGSDDITMVADQATYERGPTSTTLAADLLFVDVVKLSYGSSSTAHILERIPIEEMRLRQSTASSVGRPRFYCWWAEKLILHPAPSSADTLSIDYHKDSTRDSSSGNPITTSSTTETNSWFQFSGGESLLSARVTAEVALRHLRDQQLAGYYAVLAEAENSKLRRRLVEEAIGRSRIRGWL